MNNAALAVALNTAGATAGLPYKLVIHRHPDTDAILCLWAAQKFVVPKEVECIIIFVDAGDGLSEEEKVGFNVIEMDTGRGELDQHEKHLKRGSSFKLFCEKHGLIRDGGLKPFIELACASDNVEKIDKTSIHYLFKARRSRCKTDGDWQTFVDRAIEDLDALYGQYAAWAKSDAEFRKTGDIKTLSNGVKVAFIFGKPNLREAAYRAGADVAVWSEHRSGGKSHFGIQTSRNSTVSLRSLARTVRIAEAQERKIDIAGMDIGASTVTAIPGWYLHDSGNLLTCGTKTHPLEGNQFSKLSTGLLCKLVERTLGKLNVKSVR